MRDGMKVVDDASIDEADRGVGTAVGTARVRTIIDGTQIEVFGKSNVKAEDKLSYTACSVIDRAGSSCRCRM